MSSHRESRKAASHSSRSASALTLVRAVQIVGILAAWLCSSCLAIPPKELVNRTLYPPIINYDPENMPHVSIGLIADVQYANQEDFPTRGYFNKSLGKLKQAVEEMNANRTHLDFVMNLGDLVDNSAERYLPVLKPILEQLKYPVHHVLGNHDYTWLDESKFSTLHEMIGMPSRYYNFTRGPQSRYRFLVLDGNEISMYATHNGTAERKEAEETLDALRRMGSHEVRNGLDFNGGMGAKQIAWMKKQLADACNVQKQRVIIFIHQPLLPKNDPTVLWNDEFVPLVASYSCVLAVVSGHAHRYMYGAHHSVHRTVHFITMGGMVQSRFQTFGFMDIHEDVLRVHGITYGRAYDNHYSLKTPPASQQAATTGTAVAAKGGGAKRQASAVGDVKAPSGLPPVKGADQSANAEGVHVYTKHPQLLPERSAGGDGSAAGVSIHGQFVVMSVVLLLLLLVGILRVTRRRIWSSGRSTRGPEQVVAA